MCCFRVGLPRLLPACCLPCRYAGTAALDFLAFLYVALFYNRVVASASSLSGKCAWHFACCGVWHFACCGVAT